MIKLSPDQVQQIAFRHASAFIKAQNGQFKEHVSDTFVMVFLSQAVKMQYMSNTNPHPVNMANRAALQLFGNLLELGCNMSIQSKLVAEQFAILFEKETFKTNPNG
tara:strand:- start:7995 stop:8312 length:318 start_codon:yes stop_codon:yes gene_type:complete